MKKILWSILILLSIETHAQSCLSSIDGTPYAPSSADEIKFIKVHFHFMRDENGLNGFSETEGVDYATKMLSDANDKLANNQAMNLYNGPNPPAVLPTKFRYVLTPLLDDDNDPDHDGIYFHNDRDLYYYNPAESDHPETFFPKPGQTYPVNRIYGSQPYDVYGSAKTEVINIFIVPYHPESVTVRNQIGIGVPIRGYGPCHFVQLFGCYYYYKNPSVNPWAYGIAVNLLNHEIGHTLGLPHTWIGNDGCSDTPQNSGIWCGSSNNVMDYNCSQSAWTPCQLGRIHNLLENTTTIQHKYWLQDGVALNCDGVASSFALISTNFSDGETIKAFDANSSSSLVAYKSLDLRAQHSVSLTPGFLSKPQSGKIQKFSAGTACTTIDYNNLFRRPKLIAAEKARGVGDNELLGSFCHSADAIVTSTNDMTKRVEEQFAVFPNPAKNMLNIKINAAVSEPLKLIIYNQAGDIIFDDWVETQDYQVNVSHLTSGLYLVKISYNNYYETKKLIVE